MEKALKCELRRCEVEAMDKIAEDLVDGIIEKYYTGTLIKWKSSQSELDPVKDKNRATISDKEKVKERWVEHFENVLNRDTVAGKYIDENEKVCDTLDVKEDLFSEEELVTALKGLKNNKTPGDDGVVS